MFYKKEKISFKINITYILLSISIAFSAYGTLKSEIAIYTIKNNPDYSIGETPEKVCYYGMNSIIFGKALSSYFSTELFDYLKDNPTILNLSSDDKIIDVIYRDNTCLIVLKNEELMRGFLLPLEKSLSFPLYYRISTIKEDDVININTGIKNAKKED